MVRSDDETVRRPTPERIDAIASSLGMDLTPGEREDYAELVAATLKQIEAVAEAETPSVGPDRRYSDRPPGYRPDGEEDPHNAWITRCRVEGAADGPLAGTTVGLKDTVALAGYELTFGSSLLSGFVPEIDATVVTRILDAGGTIVGKQNMEAFAHSGTGDFSDFGPVTNPDDENYLAGGSSSGSAAAVAAGDCDVAIGGDQVGSNRIPGSWCGIVGLKPTYGLVPYTGVLASELSYDHLGPMARTVEDAARTLEVIAGVDEQGSVGLDPRQPRSLPEAAYLDELEKGVDDLAVGVLEEGFDWPFSDLGIDETVRNSLDSLADAGVTIDSVSVPDHRRAFPVCVAILTQGGARLRREGGVGTNRSGWLWTELADRLHDAIEARPDDRPVAVKAADIAATYLDEEYGVRYYAKAKNTVLAIEREYERVLAEYDALVMPTTPTLPPERDDDLDRVDRRLGRAPGFVNTGLFDMTGHPALTVPCGRVDGLPVGAMLVGGHFEESVLFRLGTVLERGV